MKKNYRFVVCFAVVVGENDATLCYLFDTFFVLFLRKYPILERQISRCDSLADMNEKNMSPLLVPKSRKISRVVKKVIWSSTVLAALKSILWAGAILLIFLPICVCVWGGGGHWLRPCILLFQEI